MTDFKVGDVAQCTFGKIRGVISKIQMVNGSVYYCIGRATFYHGDVLELVYKDQHAPMVYDKVSDTKEEAMASSETIEAIEKMME